MTGGLLLDLLDGDPDAAALHAPGDPDGLSYAQLAAAVDELVGRLAALGIERGDRAALALGPGPEFVELLLAIAALGAAAAPLNPAYGSAEFAFYLDALRPRALLLPTAELDAAREAAEARTTVLDVTLAWPGPPLLAAPGGARTGATRAAPSPDDVALLLHTSGTTSRPK